MNSKPKTVLLVKAEGRQYELASQLSEGLRAGLSKSNIIVDIVDQGISYDLAVVIGGDGTIMKVVTGLASRAVPVLGINAGDVGFLATAEAAEWELVVCRVLQGNYQLEHRLGLELHTGTDVFAPIANEVVLKHGSSVATFEVAIDEQVFYPQLMGDGVMVATATGSTGYNVSAKGPIVLPDSDNVIITPLNPMALTSHPLVVPKLPEGREVVIKLLESKRDELVQIMADGRPIEKGLAVGDSVTVRMYEHPLLFATFGLREYARALTEKKGFAR